jgi:cellulose synthase/poly-beta-1,6-N-acetylglucosamine synthase-like glycosyltransferase
VFLLINIVLFFLAFFLLISIVVLFIECSAAFLRHGSKTSDAEGVRPKIAVLVPAHNEASGIGETLLRLIPQLAEQDSIVVIADNCSDETATIARKFGAIAIERIDPERRGKGYALDYGLRYLEADPPQVVVMIDADCIVHQGAIERIAQWANDTARPVQALYLMEQPTKPSPKDAISALAFMVKNLVRPSGLEQLGLPCLLTGTGMAFPWLVIRDATLASGNIVEDMQLTFDLAIKGHTTAFCSEAKVTGRLPQQQQAAKSQRTRWEQGHVQTLLTQVPRLLKASLQQKRFDLLALALELCVPPLSLLVMMWIAVMGAALLAGSLGISWIPAIFVAIEGLLILISIVGAWYKFGRADLPVLALLAVPFYLLWKIPLYLAILVRPQTKWIRTERDTVDAPKS